MSDQPNERPPVDRSRRGKFCISLATLQRDWHDLLPIFQRVVITRAEIIFVDNVIAYDALSDDFEPVEEGMATPEYWAVAMTNSGRAGNPVVSIKWERVQS
jgi:hypothetical protein